MIRCLLLAEIAANIYFKTLQIEYLKRDCCMDFVSSLPTADSDVGFHNSRCNISRAFSLWRFIQK